ncbi:MAG: hypothetical protein ACREUO_04750 [Burkholderiales bacterium]
MSGGGLLGLILLSMGWLFFVLGATLNFQVWRRARAARDGESVPSGAPILPGVAGSLAAFFTIPSLAEAGFEVPWPWLWIMLPLFLDVYCLGGLVLAPLGFARRETGSDEPR